MGREFRYWCPVETGRLLWILGMTFAVIIAFQYFELPYSNIISNVSPTHKFEVAGNGSLLTDSDLSNIPEIISNTTPLSGLNSTGSNGAEETTDDSGKEKDVDVNNSDLVLEGITGFNKSSAMDNRDMEYSPEWLVDHPANNAGNTSSEDMDQRFSRENTTFTSESTRTSDAGNSSILSALPPASLNLSPNITFPRDVESSIITPDAPLNPNSSAAAKDSTPNLETDRKSTELQNNLTMLHHSSSVTTVPEVEKMPDITTSAVISIAEMDKLLLRNWHFPNSMRPRWSLAVDQELLLAKSQIMNAPVVKDDPLLYAPLFRNVSTFRRSYELMEDVLKVYVYKEGEKPILHDPVLKGIYASEGWFMKQMEGNKKFVTKNPRKANLFYLPFSSRQLEEKLYVPNSHNRKNLIRYLKSYLDVIVAKYPYWNRTEGADHFLVACHDWAPSETKQYMANCIRALCNADVKEGFVFGKDVSLPETNVPVPQRPLRDLGGKPASKRSILAFFAGSMHGYVRPILLQHWENKDPNMKIMGRMAKAKGKMSYAQHMKSSKYCICAKGYEVNSPRVVEAIFYECVPVIISDNFVPPFFEVLNWESFAVFILEKDITNLKNILLSIPEKRYREMQMRVKKVQQHFLWHARPVKYDLFHMILHSVWYTRVFQMHSN